MVESSTGGLDGAGWAKTGPLAGCEPMAEGIASRPTSGIRLIRGTRTNTVFPNSASTCLSHSTIETFALRRTLVCGSYIMQVGRNGE